MSSVHIFRYVIKAQKNSHRTDPQGHFGTAPRHGATFGRAQSQRKLLSKWRINLESPVPGPLNQNQPWVSCSWLSCAAKLHKAAQTLTVREISVQGVAHMHHAAFSAWRVTDSAHPDEFEFYNRSPRPCPGVKCYRTCRGHAQALHVMYMLLRREDYLNVMVIGLQVWQLM